jgi:hypothetical protein
VDKDICVGRRSDADFLQPENDHDFYIDTAAADILVHNCTGGVYTLRDGETVVRTGRTVNLARRALQHANDDTLGDFEFNTEYETDDCATQRGLEQKIYDQYPGAQAGNGGFNKIGAISPTHPNRSVYMQAAESFLEAG